MCLLAETCVCSSHLIVPTFLLFLNHNTLECIVRGAKSKMAEHSCSEYENIFVQRQHLILLLIICVQLYLLDSLIYPNYPNDPIYPIYPDYSISLIYLNYPNYPNYPIYTNYPNYPIYSNYPNYPNYPTFTNVCLYLNVPQHGTKYGTICAYFCLLFPCAYFL